MYRRPTLHEASCLWLSGTGARQVCHNGGAAFPGCPQVCCRAALGFWRPQAQLWRHEVLDAGIDVAQHLMLGDACTAMACALSRRMLRGNHA